jgi:hypothetical protein
MANLKSLVVLKIDEEDFTMLLMLVKLIAESASSGASA